MTKYSKIPFAILSAQTLFAVLLCAGTAFSACAQGLNASPHRAVGRVNLPLLKGSTDQERLNLFSTMALKLVGMKRAQIEKTFGKGYFCENEKQIQYALSSPKSAKDGKRFSYIALSIELKGERAAGFVVQSIESN